MPLAALPRHRNADAWADRLHAHAPPPGPGWPARAAAPVTALVSVKNEQADLPECLRRLTWCRDLLVVDSGSTDATVPIAQAFGARVLRFDYPRDSPTGWPKKRNWALDHAELPYPWVLLMDADEWVVPELAAQITALVAPATSETRHRESTAPARPGAGRAYWLNRRMIFRGRWVRYGGYYPAWNLRLFEHRLGRFERLTTAGDTASGDMEVHEHVRLAPEAGEAGYLDHDLLHHEIADFSEWVTKHNRYSSWEAAVARRGVDDGIPAKPFGTAQQRRRWLKRTARRLPFRPTLRFWYHFGLRQGFREGRLGLHLARLLAAYEAMTLAKTHEADAHPTRPAASPAPALPLTDPNQTAPPAVPSPPGPR